MPIAERTGTGRHRRVAWAVLAVASVSGCAQYIGTTAGSFLRHAREDRDPNLRHLAYARLADPHCYDDEQQKDEAVKLLATRLEEKKEPVITRALICRSLGELRHPDGREALRHACDDDHPVIRAAACRALGMIGKSEDSPVLARIMAADSDGDCRIAAIEGLGAMRSADNRVLETLADGMENPDPSVRLASYVALQRLTSKDLGTDVAAWKRLVADRAEPTDPVVQKASTEAPEAQKAAARETPKAATEAPKSAAAKAPKAAPSDFTSPPTPELR